MDNGREFNNKLVEDLCLEWKVKFIHGKPRKSQSKGGLKGLIKKLGIYYLLT